MKTIISAELVSPDSDHSSDQEISMDMQKNLYPVRIKV
jgi:hypothetical protein